MFRKTISPETCGKNVRRQPLWLIFISLLAVFLRIYRLGAHTYWCDEFLAIFLGENSFAWMTNYITYHDAHPPLFYVLTHFMLKAGNSEHILRLLPCIFGILCIPLAFSLGKKLFDEKTGLIFAFLLAINPAHILWSQTLKAYTLFTFLLLVSFYFFYSLLISRKKSFWIGLFISNLCLLYLHNFAFCVVFIQGIFLLLRKKLNRTWILYYVLLLVSYIPWLVRIPYQLQFTSGVRRGIPVLYRYLYYFFYLFLGESVHPFYLPVIIPTVLVSGFLLIAGLIAVCKSSKDKRIFMLTGLFIPLMLIPFPSTVPQNLIAFSVFWYLTAALAIRTIRFSTIPAAILTVVCLTSCVFYYSGQPFHYHDTSKLIPYREINNFLSRNVKQGDVVIINDKREFLGKKPFSAFDWYYNGTAPVIEATEEKTVKAENLQVLLKDYDRYWLFLNFNQYPPNWCRELKEFFDTHYEKTYEQKFLWNERILQKVRKNGKKYYYLIELHCYEKSKSSINSVFPPP